jgi:hypothetical protein
MQGYVAPGGLLILAEGFREGFDRLSEIRSSLGIPPLQPASINVYSSLSQILPELDSTFQLEDEFHLGMYDYLTRIVYPFVVGPDNVRHNTVFSERARDLARAFNPDAVKDLSRLRGFVYRKQP